MALICAAAIAVTAASISVRKINCTVVSGQAHFCTLPTVIIDAGHGGLTYTKKSSDVKNIIDTLGIPEKVERFTIRERRFITNEFGKEVALPVCEMIIE